MEEMKAMDIDEQEEEGDPHDEEGEPHDGGDTQVMPTEEQAAFHRRPRR